MLSVFFFVLCLFNPSRQEISGETKDVNYYLKLIKENIENAQNFTVPTDNRRFFGNCIPDESEAKEFGEFDFIIVGAGSSGSVIFNRLSKKRNWKVLLLEAGGEEDDFSDIPSMMYYTQFSDKNWGYKTTSQNGSCLGMVDNQCSYPRGRVIGGSGTINALMYVRGNKNDFDRWEEAGNPNWSYRNVLKYFKKSEHAEIDDIDELYHSRYGQLNVTHVWNPFTKYFLGANEEMGFNYVDYNGRTQMGYSNLQLNINQGKRVSGGRAYVDPVRKESNVKIVTNALVTKVLLKNYTAYGVNFLRNGKLYKATVRKEVIISAGAINTPQLLMLSGIGPKEHLEELKIPIVKDLPVGKYFQDHPYFSLNFQTNHTFKQQSNLDSVQEYLDGKGFFPYALAHSIKFINTEYIHSKTPDIEYIFIALPGASSIIPKALNLRPDIAATTSKNKETNTNIKLFIVLLHPKSYGEIKLKSNSPLDFPEINTNFFSDKNNADLETIYRAILHGLAMLDTDDFKHLNAKFSMNFEYCNDHEMFSKDYWFCAIRHLGTTLYHSSGTTRMGIDSTTSVVDNALKVHGIENLRIADCGIIPSTTSGHTNAVAFMIGEKMAEILIQEYF